MSISGAPYETVGMAFLYTALNSTLAKLASYVVQTIYCGLDSSGRLVMTFPDIHCFQTSGASSHTKIRTENMLLEFPTQYPTKSL